MCVASNWRWLWKAWMWLSEVSYIWHTCTVFCIHPLNMATFFISPPNLMTLAMYTVLVSANFQHLSIQQHSNTPLSVWLTLQLMVVIHTLHMHTHTEDTHGTEYVKWSLIEEPLSLREVLIRRISLCTDTCSYLMTRPTCPPPMFTVIPMKSWMLSWRILLRADTSWQKHCASTLVLASLIMTCTLPCQ